MPLPLDDLRTLVSRLAPTRESARALRAAIDAPLRLTRRERNLQVAFVALRGACLAAIVALVAIWLSAPPIVPLAVLGVLLVAEVAHSRVSWAMPGGDPRAGQGLRRLVVLMVLGLGASIVLLVTGRVFEAVVVCGVYFLAVQAVTLSSVASARVSDRLPEWPSGVEAVAVMARLSHILGWTKVRALAAQCSMDPAAVETALTQLAAAGLVRKRADKANLTGAGRTWLADLRAEVDRAAQD